LSEKIVQVSGITKSYFIGRNELQVLKGIDFTIDRGEIIAVIGASGAGKSTLLHIVGTLDKPTGGKVLFDGEDVFNLSDEKIARFRSLQIGFVFQFHHLLPEFTALENVAMPALIAGMKLGQVKGHAHDLLAEVGLADRAEHRPSELSGGEQQRVAVARALINGPKVVLADEPSGNLDSVNAEALHRLLLDLCRNHSTTFLIATHNDHLTSLAHRVFKIQDGVLVA
jgi:lipoprotein-releasing system ATP-binding protein